MTGQGTWNDQQAWVSGLTIGGIGGWRLPSVDVNGDDTIISCFVVGIAGCSDNEMGFLFREEGITAASPGVFTNVQPNDYWSVTEFAIPFSAWNFNFNNGNRSVDGMNFNFFTWAVHSGDVGAQVPEPGTLALMGLGLMGLLGFGRQQRRR